MKIKPFKTCIKKTASNFCNNLEIHINFILCMFNIIHTFGPMGIPLRTAATTNEKSMALLVRMSYIKKKKNGIIAPNV